MAPLALVSDRRLPDWIDTFIEFTAEIQSPELFRKWAAITTIAAALERKVWVTLSGGPVYPNIYTVLCGGPGVGKGEAIKQAAELWKSLEEHRRSPSSMSRASLIDALAEANRSHIRWGQGKEERYAFNALFILSTELGVLLPQYDHDFMNTLTDIYDGVPYEERKRSKEIHNKIPNPQFNILAGTTPSYLNSIMPEGAWDQGFISRVFLVYSGASTPRDIFSPRPQPAKQADLQADLKFIGGMFGEIEFTKDSRDAITAWHLKRGEPIPEHPRLAKYITRRTVHLVKLCMIAAASHGRMEIDLDEYQEALNWLEQMEAEAPNIFISMGRSDATVIEETWYFVYNTHTKERKPIEEGRLMGFLMERTPAPNVRIIMDLMVRSRMLRVEATAVPSYTPGRKL